MKMVIVPRYADLFNEPIPELKDLLIDISSEVIIGLLSMIQAKLHLANNEFGIQREILQLFLRRQSIDIQQSFIVKAFKTVKEKGREEFSIFSMHYTLDFMHYVLCHYAEQPMTGDDTTPEQEYKLLKAYIIFIELRHVKDEQIVNENKDHPDDFFYKNTWPIISGQYEAEHIINPFTEMIRGIVLFNFLEYSSPYTGYIRYFLNKCGHTSCWNYVFALVSIIQQSWEKMESQNGRSYSFSISVTEEFEPLFRSFALDTEIYKTTYITDPRNYSGIKDKPLFRYQNGSYLILNWNFFSNKLYEGLLFDLYTHSGLAETKVFKIFPNFKQYISEVVTEGFLFKKLLCAALQKKHSVLLFDEKLRPGFPDAYYRFGNDIILFEIKDAFFPAKAISTTSYQTIKDAIDEKYNQPHKGTGQLISQLTQMISCPFEAQKGYKHTRNLTVYPVMIYTDHFFSMPGINNYLEEAFIQKLEDACLIRHFKKIQPLVFINIRFLINHLGFFRKKGTELTDLFEMYYKEQIRVQKKAKRIYDLTTFFDCYQTFETTVKSKREDVMYREEGFVKTIVDILELTQGLPPILNDEDK